MYLAILEALYELKNMTQSGEIALKAFCKIEHHYSTHS